MTDREPRVVTYQMVLAELRTLRELVAGVMEAALASVDGLLVAADTDADGSVRPEVLAAMSAATLSLGKRTGYEVGMGELREVVIRCAGGYIVVYAVRQEGLLVVLADEGLDITRLHMESRLTVERLGVILTGDRVPG